MSLYTTSANMSLLLPTVGEQLSPTWAEQINASLSLIDQHDHTSGNGVPIPPSGLDISSDLPFGNNNATGLRSARFQVQSAALALGSDLGCLYVTGVDLYFNDINGNHIQITSSGGVAGTPGSIGSLTSPASATYVAGTPAFVFQSDVNTPATLDGGSLILRNILASSKGLTLNAPATMAADYSVTFPAALPASQKFATLDASGNLAATWAVDNSTLEVNSNSLRIKDSGVVTAKIADANVTRPKLEAVGEAVSNSSGAFSTASATGSGAHVDNLTRIHVTSGRPVIIALNPDGSSNQSILGPSVTANGVAADGYLYVLRDGVILARYSYRGGTCVSGSTSYGFGSPPTFVDVVAAGSYTYTINVRAAVSGSTMYCSYFKLVVYEL